MVNTRAEEDRSATAPDQVDFTPWAVAFGRLTGRVRRTRAAQRVVAADQAWRVLAAMIAVWSLVFGVLVWQRHDRFASFSFDLGIFDQATWLLSRFDGQFITVRGLPVFGHHVEPALYLFVPFYWLGAGPHFLNLAQVLSMALGTVPVFLLARHRLGNGWIALPLCAAFLLHPSLQFLAWETFHPEVMAITPLLFAYWFSVKRQWGWFAVCAVLAVAWKEDVALAVFVLGLLIAYRGDRQVGLRTAGLALAWFLLSSRVIIPFVSGSEPFYNQFFSDLGDTPGEMIKNAVAHPSRVTDRLTAPDAQDYMWKMIAPFAFVPLAALGPLAIGLPQTLVNLLSVNDFTRKITYHYAALVLAALIVATVEAIGSRRFWPGDRPGVRRFLVGLVASTSLAATVAWGISPLGTQFEKGWWPGPVDSRRATKEAALARVPDDAAVSATYLFVPHLTHRRRIYEFPNPFKPKNWGVRDEKYPPPTAADWLVVDRQLLGEEDKAVFENALASGQFQILFNRDDIVVARRPAAGG